MSTDQNHLQRRPQILCVDDEPALREVIAICLRREGFEVETAPDGLAAWTKLSNEADRFDLVITDNFMPHMTGLQLVERLRSQQFPGRIIVFSSTFTAESVERLDDLRIDAVVEKGRPLSDLFTAVRKALSSK